MKLSRAQLADYLEVMNEKTVKAMEFMDKKDAKEQYIFDENKSP